MTTGIMTLAAQRPLPTAELRPLVAKEREAITARLGAADAAPGAASKALSELMAALAVALFEGEAEREAGGRVADGVALLAVGGFGRRELAPCSDLDLCILVGGADARGRAERIATGFFQGLWDLGLDLGHAVRDLADIPRVLAEDLQAASALLWARRLWGDARLLEGLEEGIRAHLSERDALSFLSRKLEELDALHARYGRHPCHTQPQLKAGAGGLRDHEVVRMAARLGLPPDEVLPGEDEAQALTRALDALLDLRFALHLAAGRRQERLGFDLMPEVFGRLEGGDGPADGGRVEAAMWRHFEGAQVVTRAVSRLREVARRRLEPAPPRPIRLGDGLVQVGESIAAEAGTPLEDAGPARILALFRRAQERRLAIPTSVLDQVRRARARIPADAWEAPEVAAAFRDLLGSRGRIAESLEAMHAAGVLGEILPEFGALTGLFRLDPYHALTVDAHLLRCVACLEKLSSSPERNDQLRADLLHAQDEVAMLRLAALLHDMGKGKGGDHVRIGGFLVPDIVRRLGLSLAEGRLLRFLVRSHMRLAETADMRQVDDDETIRRFLARIPSVAELDLLYLLSCADARATSPQAFPRWRDALFTELYHRARARLEAGTPAPLDARAHRKQTLAILRELSGHDATAETYDRHAELAPRRYLLELDPDEVAQHLLLVERLEAGEDPAIARAADGPLHALWVVSRDRPGLLARMAGAAAASRASIIGAAAYTRQDGITLDRLILAVPPELAAETSFWEGLERMLREVIHEERRPEDLIDAARRRIDAGPAPGAAAGVALARETAVRVSNRISDRYTVVEVETRDRIGLLFELCTKLYELGLDIGGAKISTRADRAVDVFYVARDGAKVPNDDLGAIREALQGI